MPPIDTRYLEKLANEAFLRRAATVDAPFMLKGSYVTRQYFNNPADRIPNDLDWVCTSPIPNSTAANTVFNDWATRVTELALDDGVRFRSFRENAFWRMIDYAMSDDFPTVNTDLLCWVNGQELELSLDVSFNLPLETPSIPLLYRPEQGMPFHLPSTVPLALQVAWKLHQTLVRPRFKDVFDLLHLLRHPQFDIVAQRQCLRALDVECRADNTNLNKVRGLLQGKLAPFWNDTPVEDAWLGWRHGQRPSHKTSWPFFERAENITDPSNLPENLAIFEQQLREAFQQTSLAALMSAPQMLQAILPSDCLSASDPTQNTSYPGPTEFFRKLLKQFRRKE